MNNEVQYIKNKEILRGNKFISWGLFLIILGPILGVVSIFLSSIFVGMLISTNEGVEVLMILGGISTVGTGISLVMIGCTKNIIQKIEK